MASEVPEVCFKVPEKHARVRPKLVIWGGLGGIAGPEARTGLKLLELAAARAWSARIASDR